MNEIIYILKEKNVDKSNSCCLLFFKNKRVDGVKKNDKLISDEMVECPTCSTFVSQKEAIVSSGKFFCSKDCLNNKKA